MLQIQIKSVFWTIFFFYEVKSMKKNFNIWTIQSISVNFRSIVIDYLYPRFFFEFFSVHFQSFYVYIKILDWFEHFDCTNKQLNERMEKWLRQRERGEKTSRKLFKVVNSLNEINVIRRDKIFSIWVYQNVWINSELANDGRRRKHKERKVRQTPFQGDKCTLWGFRGHTECDRTATVSAHIIQIPSINK